jgi:hypothetical protein
MKWKLQVFRGEWEDVAERSSGDACKTRAREYQRGWNVKFRFRILDPGGSFWLCGEEVNGRFRWSETFE